MFNVIELKGSSRRWEYS